jgi:transcriptional regulator with XRE-family HTH domain
VEHSKFVLPSEPLLEKAKEKKYEIQLEDRLRALRHAYGKTLKEMAEVLGVTISTYAGYEAKKDNKNHRVPALEKILKLSDYFGVSVDYLVGASDLRAKYTPLDIKEMAEKADLEPHVKATFDFAITKISESKETVGA